LALAGAYLGFGLCLAAGGEPEIVDFTRQVQPILSAYCFACHGPDAKARQADLRLDARKEATISRDGTTAIVPGHPESSELLRRVQATDADERMPPASTGKRLTRADIQTLGRWIKQGAVYARHWAYVRPVRPPQPEVRHRAWPRNSIDYFILARLEKEGLEPAPPADATALVRRVALDATGLPPRLEEIERFVADSRADAYERLVDEQLAKPSYGEHWARAWLDAARYADSTGYAEDQPREIWAFRDYVIRSINANKSFDRFTIEQIAGDLLPHPTDEQIVATAFHRNTQTNTEGGTDREEFRNVAVVDRVNTTWTVWMGTTMACAQCHDHKYDPISQKEFFRFFAIFNNTEDADRRDEAPLHSFWTDGQQREKKRLEREIARVEATQLPGEVAKLRIQLDGLKKQLAAIKPHTVPIIQELPANKRRVTCIQYRGNFLDRGPEVTPGVPSVFPPLPTGKPPNRLTLARWFVSPDNPLTARVTVNRYWEKLFGTGLVATSEDFGSQGELPSHPELLDWLATELVSSGWDIKHLLRLMLTSATYRQSSRATPELLARDLDNRLLARGPRFRMDAEVIRDQALSAAGLLSPKMYGPPVRPLQPAFGLSAAFGRGMDWQTSDGEDRYRRGLYVTWRRTNPYPSLVTFDSCSREVCAVRRARTNTPLQALVTLNDPVYVEAAQAMARRMIREGGVTAEDRACYGFRLCVARRPQPAELSRLLELQRRAEEQFAGQPEQAKRMATAPLGPAPVGMNVAQLAAWTVVANVLLNLDETLMRR
jgi:hypothetical protein